MLYHMTEKHPLLRDETTQYVTEIKSPQSILKLKNCEALQMISYHLCKRIYINFITCI